MKNAIRLCLALLATAAVVTAGTVAPAVARSAPDQVGRVTVVSATTSSLTFQWPAAARADSYVVERSSNLAMSDRREVARTTGRQLTVSGLRSGGFSCFQVRAKNEDGLGKRSRKACQYTIADQGRTSGASYRVVTYNTCAVVCSRWGARRGPAASLVRGRHADVVMLQETPRKSGMAGAIGGMTQVAARSGKALLYRTKRFFVAKNGSGKVRRGSVDLGLDPARNRHRFAVWAELVDRTRNNKHVLFVSVHLSPGGDSAANDATRRKNTTRLLHGLDAVNPRNLPVVIAGDFNSNQGRDFDSPSQLMAAAGLGNSYFLAEHWTRPNYNSATKNRIEPPIGTPWGFHVDQVWVDPAHSVVEEWANAAQLVDGLYPAPQISNHAPVLVQVLVN